MRKSLLSRSLITIISICFFSATAAIGQKGQLSGQVYYLYNNYIGNRPDAGAKIIITSISDTTRILETTTDLSGKFELSNLSTGDYIICVRSKAQTSRPYMSYLNFISNNDNIKAITGLDLKNYNLELQEEIKMLTERYWEENNKKRPKLAEIKKIELRRDDVAIKFIRGAFDALRKKTGILTSFDRIHIEKVSIIDNNETKINVDFGISYM